MGEASANKLFLDAALRTVLFLCVALVVPMLAFHSGIEGANPYHVISISADISAMLTGYVLLVGLYVDKKKSGKTTHYLIGLVVSTYIACFTDAMAWIVQDEPEYVVLNYIVNTIWYIAGILEALYLWRYTLTYLRVKNKRINTVNLIANIGFAVCLVLIFLNIPFGFYFTVNSAGAYIRSPWNIISIFYSLFSVIASLSVVVVERRQLRWMQILAFFLYASGPLIVTLMTIFVFGLSLNPSVAMLSILLMYCALNVTQGDERAVAENEIAIASSIQENVLPKAFPYLPERKEFDIYAVMKPAKEVGGDFYDFFMVDDSHLALVIADVSGKGIPAALFMMTGRTLIKNRVQAGDNLTDIMADVNNQLCEGNVADLFITVWIGIIDLNTGQVKAVNAGHEYPAILRANGKFELEKGEQSLAVAFFEGTSFKEQEFELAPGDKIFVYTDGVTESMNEEEELFSKERLLDVLNKNSNCSPKEMIEKVLDSIAGFVNGVEQFDDTTMLCMTYFGPQ